MMMIPRFLDVIHFLRLNLSLLVRYFDGDEFAAIGIRIHISVLDLIDAIGLRELMVSHVVVLAAMVRTTLITMLG